MSFASGGAAEVCDKVTGAGTADITAVDASSINIGSFLTRGYDLEATYSVPLSGGGNLYPTNPVYFDTIGRRFRAGVRIEF